MKAKQDAVGNTLRHGDSIAVVQLLYQEDGLYGGFVEYQEPVGPILPFRERASKDTAPLRDDPKLWDGRVLRVSVSAVQLPLYGALCLRLLRLLRLLCVGLLVLLKA